MDYTTYLVHHGIKGQKWGVRRYQNPDGTLTAEGKKRLYYRNNVLRNRPHTNDVNEIVSSMSKEDKERLGAELDEPWINVNREAETLSGIANTFVEKIGNTPVAFAEAWIREDKNGKRVGQIAIGTRSGDQYRGKGAATRAFKSLDEWVSRYGNKTLDELEWWARDDNVGSRKIAEKAGFEYDEKKSSEYEGWSYYRKKVNKR